MNVFKRIAITGLMFSVLTACMEQPLKPQQVTLRFVPFVGQQPLEFNEYRYANPGGEGDFKIRDFQFYLSNIRLSGNGQVHRVADSYHLVRFDNETGVYEIDLTITDPEQYSLITMGIGVDTKANGTILNVGDLDPNSRMAWSWDVGYKFVLLEGLLKIPGDTIPLVYHVGFDENYRELSLPLAPGDTSGGSRVNSFRVDVLSLFSGATPLNMADLPSVKFDEQDAKRIASGFGNLISACAASCT